MGFPVGYADLFIPKLIIHIITLLTFIHTFISYILQFINLEHLIEFDSQQNPPQLDPITHFQSFSSVLICELLPVVKFSEIIDPPDSCAVCLYEFDDGDEIRVLSNCRHVFHKCCIDRWMDHDRKTCPLCRITFINDDLQESFNERLWAASGIDDYYGDLSLVGTS